MAGINISSSLAKIDILLCYYVINILQFLAGINILQSLAGINLLYLWLELMFTKTLYILAAGLVATVDTVMCACIYTPRNTEAGYYVEM